MNRMLVALPLLLASTGVLAIGSVTGKVVQVRVDSTGNGMVIFDTDVGGAFASCRSNYYAKALAFKAGEGGRAILSLALAAKATGATITAYGTGSCATFSGNVEDWDYGVMQ